MSFPKYPAYKDSGVEWLGEVPQHWDVRPLKWLAEQITDKASTSDFQVGLENIEGWTGRFIETDAEFSGDGVEFRKGDVLFGKLRPYLAKVWLAGRSGQAVGDFFVLRSHAINCEFLHKYILSPAVIDDLNASTIGAKMPRVGWEDMAGLAVALPSHEEQNQIARCLDHETARIDALIEEQQRLIELLNEKRQAVISHAVTKGLDPSVPMKDSGVEWLGEVPAHWVVSRVKNVASFITSGPRGWSDYIDESGEDIFLQSGDMDDRLNVLFEKAKRINTPAGAEGVRTRVQTGDVVVCITGANTGRVAVLGQVHQVSYVNQHLGLLRLSLSLCKPRYIGYSLSSIACQTYFGLEQYGLKEGLSLTDLAEAPVLVPPLAEQVQLVDAIEEQLRKLEKLTVDSEKAIKLLQERRSTLISAAVTGKIDLRGWQRPAGTPAPIREQETA